MIVSRTTCRFLGCVGLVVASATAGFACGTDDNGIDAPAGPPTEKSESTTTETTQAQPAEPIDDFDCDRLDEDKVADIIGEFQSGPFEGQATINNTSYDKAGCGYFLLDETGDYAIAAVTSSDVNDIFAFLLNHAAQDEFDDRFAPIDDLGDDAFIATTTGASDNLDLFVKVGADTLQVSSDLDNLEQADLDEVQDNLHALAELALDELE